MEEELQQEILKAIKNVALCTEDFPSIQAFAKPAILKYIDNYSQIIAKKITGQEKSEQLEYIKDLVMIYPFSAKIIDNVFRTNSTRRISVKKIFLKIFPNGLILPKPCADILQE